MATGRVPTTANSPLTAKGDLFGYSTTQARVPVGNDGETLVADSSTTTGLRWQAPKTDNAVYNSSFDIWQRGTSFTGVSPYYGADRWVFVRSAGVAGATWTRQSSGLTGFNYSVRAQRNSGNTSTNPVKVGQSLETADSLKFAGKTVTFSFYAKAGANYSPTSSFLEVYIYTGTGTDEQFWTNGFTGASLAAGTSVTLTTSWQRFSVTANIASNANEIAFGFEAPSTGTAGTNDWYEVTGVQLEQASVATPYTRMSGTLAGELAAAQRYYYRMTVGAAGQHFGVGSVTTTTLAQYVIAFPTTMRIAPTALEQTGTAGDYSVRTQNTNTTCSAVPTHANASKDTAVVSFTVASGLTAGDASFARPETANAYLGWSAEL